MASESACASATTARSKSLAEHQTSERGFTLLEMLVALAVFSLAALALVRLQAVSLRTTVDLENRAMAGIVAQNLAVEAVTDPVAPARGQAQGVTTNGGRNWRWTRIVAPTDDQRLVRVTIRVDGQPGTSPATLTVVRPAV